MAKTKDYVLLMARYNTWQNQNLITAASSLDQASGRPSAAPSFGLHREDPSRTLLVGTTASGSSRF